jgi:hypothetical protein
MTKRIVIIVLCIAYLLLGQTGYVAPVTMADITGDNAAHKLQASGSAKWVQFVAQSSNTGTARVGDSTCSATRGIPLAASTGFMFPPIPSTPGQAVPGAQLYDLASIYYYAATGDKLSVTWGN